MVSLVVTSIRRLQQISKISKLQTRVTTKLEVDCEQSPFSLKICGEECERRKCASVTCKRWCCEQLSHVAWASEGKKERLHWFHTMIWILLWQVTSMTPPTCLENHNPVSAWYFTGIYLNYIWLGQTAVLFEVLQHVQVAVPDKIESFILDQVHLLTRPNARRYKPCLTKFYCFNYAMLWENFLKKFSKETDSSYIYTSQCHASR